MARTQAITCYSNSQWFFVFLLALLFLGASSLRPQSQGNPESQDQKQSNSPAQPHRAASKQVVFLIPEDGAIVHPGEKFHVEVSVPPGMTLDGMSLLSPLGFSEEIRGAPPYSFTMTVPDEELHLGSGHLIGRHAVAARGGVKGQNSEELGSIQVDVEAPGLPVKLEGADGMMNQYNNEMCFLDVGTDTRLLIYGTFPDGKELDVTDSTHLKLLSGNAAIIRVSDDGTVTSSGPGRTSVIATYSLGERNIRIMVPVKVEVPSSGVVPTPRTLDFGNQTVGTTSEPLRVTLTNQTDSSVSISKFEFGGIFKESDDCTAVPLPQEGGTCTLTVTFTPDRVGPQHLRVTLSNSSNYETSVLLVGNGV